MKGVIEMKKLFAIFVAAIAGLFLLSSCRTDHQREESLHGSNVNQLEGVSIALSKDTYQQAGDTFELTIRNHSEVEMTYGAPYTLEIYDEDTWYIVEPNEEISFIMIAYTLNAGDEATEEVNLAFYEPLKTGHYRLVRLVNEEPLTAEFEVTTE